MMKPSILSRSVDELRHSFAPNQLGDLFKGLAANKPSHDFYVLQGGNQFERIVATSRFARGSAILESAVPISSIPSIGTNGKIQTTLLIVDDDTQILRASSRILKGDFEYIVTASNIEEALAALLATHGPLKLPVGMILSDNNLAGGETGLDFLRQAIQLKPHVKAMLNSGLIKQLLDDMTDDEKLRWPVIEKPFSPKDIKETARQKALEES